MMNKYVPSEFPSGDDLKIAFVGEAPGEEEMRLGRPFVGPAGRVFNAILRSANIDRDSVMVTNVWDVKADKNDVAPWMKEDAREFTQPHLDRLYNELADYAPNVIVPMGNPALWALTGFTNISQFRGAVTKATRGGDWKLLPTYHPSFVQRQWKYLPVVTGDFIKAAAEAEKGPQIIYPKVRLYIDPTIEEVEEWCEKCKTSPLLACDIETGWGQITSIGFAPTPNEALNIPFVDKRRPNNSYWRTTEEEVRAWKAIVGVLEHPVPKVGQNFLYDAYWLWTRLRARIRNYLHDTRLMHHALFPELEKSLAFMGASYTELGSWKHWGHFSRTKRDE